MNEQFDNDLKNHIGKVFENFEDPDADAGWLLLRKQFPEKEKDRGIAWLWFGTAAAILLVLLGIGTWINFNKDDRPRVAHKPIKTLIEKNSIAQIKPSAKNHPGTITQNNAVKTTVVQNTISAGAPIPKQSGLLTRRNRNFSGAQAHRLANSAPGPVTSAVADTNHETIAANTSEGKNAPEHGKTNTTTLSAADTAARPMVAANRPTRPAATIGDKDDKLKFTSQTKKAIDRSIAFGIYAATYFNYARGSSNQLNVGAGVTAEINLTKNLKLSSGMAIAQNSLSYDNQPGLTAPQNFISSTNNAVRYQALYANAVGNTTGSSVNFKNYNAQLVGLDIPVNLKYNINPDKSTGYVQLGLSSGTFINQLYTYQYAYAIGNNAGQTQSQTNTSSFSGFYFGRMLNVSFGITYPVGKNNLAIEPFLKYPLQGLGDQQIKFGAGGINLKFDLKPYKK